MDAAYPERKESLWSLGRAPLIWAVHFMLCYLTAAIYCAKLGGAEGDLGPARIAIALFTVAAASVLGWTGWRSYRRMRAARPPFGRDTHASRSAFMGYIDLLLSILSLVAVVLSALPAAFIGTCE